MVLIWLSLPILAAFAGDSSALPIKNAPDWGPSITLDTQTGGKPISMLDGVVGPSLRWGERLRGDFTLSIWMQADAACLAAATQKPVAMWELRNDMSGDRLVLQMGKAGSIDLVLAEQNQAARSWPAVGHPVKTDEWMHVVLVRRSTTVGLFVNGAPYLSAKVTLSDGWNTLTIGRGGSRPPWIGRAWLPVIFRSAADAKAIEAEARQRGYYIGGITPPPLSKGIEPAPVMTQGRYPSLQVVPDGLHPLIDQLHVSTAVMSWSGPGSTDLLIRARNAKLFGSRMAIFSEVGRDSHGLPVFDHGTTIEGISGKEHVALARATPPGGFDLVALGEGTSFGANALVQYHNKGKPGAPVFTAEAQPVWVDGKTLDDAVGRKVCAWCIGDIDGDSIVDLLVAVQSDQPSNYWPDGGKAIWNGIDRPDVGRGRGYDTKGDWLGEKLTTELRWAKGSQDSQGLLSFGKPKTVYDRSPDYIWRWRSWTADRAIALLPKADGLWILHAGSEDQLMAMRTHSVEGNLLCDPAEPVLANGKLSLTDTYFPVKINVADLDGDQVPELVIDGNPGRIVVLKGEHIGDFHEVGSISMRGGPLAADTLTTPARADWTGDGRPDLITGDASGRLILWRGTSSPFQYEAPEPMMSQGIPIRHTAGENNGSIQGPGERVWGYLQPTVGDWNGDDTLAIIANDIRGELMLYPRTADPVVLGTPRPLLYKGKQLPTGWRSRPAILSASHGFAGVKWPVLLYLDWDGDLAVAIPAAAGSTQIERIEKLHYEDGTTIRLCGGGGLWGRAKLAAADWTGNGVWDVVFGTNGTSQRFFMQPPFNSKAAMPLLLENTGSSSNPVFRKPRAIMLADSTPIDLGAHNASVWPTDLDGDSLPDLISGAEDGKVYYFLRKALKW